MLHELMKDLTAMEAIVLISGLGTVLGGIALAVRRTWPVVKGFVAFMNAFNGETKDDVPPGFTPRPGVLDRLASLEQGQQTALSEIARAVRAAEGAQNAAEVSARASGESASQARRAAENGEAAAADAAAAREVAEGVAAQLQTNGGSTLRDALDRVERSLLNHIASVDTGEIPKPPTPDGAG